MIDFVTNHQGCTTEEAFDAVKEIMARGTFFKLLKELKKDSIVIAKKKKSDGRESFLFVESTNPLVTVPRLLEDFELAFKLLMEESRKRIYTRQKKGSLNTKTDNGKLTSISPVDKINLLYVIPMLILNLLTDTCTFQSTFDWAIKIRDKELQKRLFGIVFTKLGEIQLHLIDIRAEMYPLEAGFNTFHSILAKEKFEKTGTITSINKCLQLFQDLQMPVRTIERVFDLIWALSKGIGHLIFPEPLIFDWSFDFEKDDWRTLIRKQQQNPRQIKASLRETKIITYKNKPRVPMKKPIKSCAP